MATLCPPQVPKDTALGSLRTDSDVKREKRRRKEVGGLEMKDTFKKRRRGNKRSKEDPKREKRAFWRFFLWGKRIHGSR